MTVGQVAAFTANPKTATKDYWQINNPIAEFMTDLVERQERVTGGQVSKTQELLGIMIDKLCEQNIYNEETVYWDMDFVLPSAQLYDVGKIAIEEAVLGKPGKLTSDEFLVMKTHVRHGVDVIMKMGEITNHHVFFQHAKAFAGAHHERWDGRGYPHGLAGTDIPLEGQLMAIVDVFCALVSVRPYRKAHSPTRAAEIINAGRGTRFDPLLVDVFNLVSEQFIDNAYSFRPLQFVSSF